MGLVTLTFFKTFWPWNWYASQI